MDLMSLSAREKNGWEDRDQNRSSEPRWSANLHWEPKKTCTGSPKKTCTRPQKKLALEGQKMKDRRRFLRSTLKNPQGGAKKMCKSTALIIIIEICLVHYDVLIKENIISLHFKKVFH